eukprot:5962116-Pyramimonas_sp.AAC.1
MATPQELHFGTTSQCQCAAATVTLIRGAAAVVWRDSGAFRRNSDGDPSPAGLLMFMLLISNGAFPSVKNKPVQEPMKRKFGGRVDCNVVD